MTTRTVFTARALRTVALFLVLGTVTQSPALGAARRNSPVASVGHRATNVGGCLGTRVLTTDRASLRYPSCWHLSKYPDDSTMTRVLAFLSNQPTHPPCDTTRSATTTTTRCGFPIKALENGGVLVMFVEGGMPGWTIANQTGQRVVVDHHVARETVSPKPNDSLHATEVITIFIDRGIPDNYYELDAFFRNPGVAEDRRLLQRMLYSMRIE